MYQQWQEMKECFSNVMSVRVWHGPPNDSTDSNLQSEILEPKWVDLQRFLARLKPDDPLTAVTIVFPSYTTGFQRALLADGKPTIGVLKKIREKAKQRAKEEAIQKVTGVLIEEEGNGEAGRTSCIAPHWPGVLRGSCAMRLTRPKMLAHLRTSSWRACSRSTSTS
jgi:hypothetical protein